MASKMISPTSFLIVCGTIATPEAIHCALAVLRTSQSHLETEESLCPIPLATQLQDSKLCLDGSSLQSFSTAAISLQSIQAIKKEREKSIAKALSI